LQRNVIESFQIPLFLIREYPARKYAPKYILQLSRVDRIFDIVPEIRPMVSASSCSNPKTSATTAAERVSTGARFTITQFFSPSFSA
jgi:hypothetical protein